MVSLATSSTRSPVDTESSAASRSRDGVGSSAPRSEGSGPRCPAMRGKLGFFGSPPIRGRTFSPGLVLLLGAPGSVRAGMNMSEWIPIGGEIDLSNLCRLLQFPIVESPFVCPRVKVLHQDSARADCLRLVLLMSSRADFANHGVAVCVQIGTIRQIPRSALVVQKPPPVQKIVGGPLRGVPIPEAGLGQVGVDQKQQRGFNHLFRIVVDQEGEAAWEGVRRERIPIG